MSSYVDHWRRLAVGFSVTLASAFATAEMTCTALAQDQGSWAAVSAMPTGTGDSGVAALDGKIYVVGGSSFYPHIVPTSPDMGSGTWGSSVNYAYDPATDKWSQLAPIPIGLNDVGVVGFDHKLYAFGGFTSLIHANAQNAALVYDPATNSWQWLPPLSSRRGSVSAAEVGGKIYVFGCSYLMTQRHSTFTRSTIRRPISGPQKLQCHLRATIWASRSSMAKSTSSADAPEVKPTTSTTPMFMTRLQINGQRQHQC